MDFFLQKTCIYAKQYHGKRKLERTMLERNKNEDCGKAKLNFGASVPQEGDQGPQDFDVFNRLT